MLKEYHLRHDPWEAEHEGEVDVFLLVFVADDDDDVDGDDGHDVYDDDDLS